MTFAGAAVLGLLDAYYLQFSDKSWFPQSIMGFGISGMRASIPTIVLFIALLARPQSRLRAGVVRIREQNKVPAWSTSVMGAVSLIAVVVAISGMLTRSNTLLLLNGFTFAIVALSLVPLTGYAGQMSLAPLTFAGLGAIAMSKLPGDGNLLTLIAAVVIVALVGALVALPAIRLSGIYLALSTAAFAVLVTKLIFNQKQTFMSGNISVPVLDMVRSEQRANGVANIPEYGTVKVEAEFHALLRNSSYHSVKNSVRYPATMLMHGVNDSRVDVWQSLKFASRLADAQKGAQPVLLRLDYDAGHGSGSSSDQGMQRTADLQAFMLWQMGEAEFQPVAK
jgi:hypothetical protein